MRNIFLNFTLASLLHTPLAAEVFTPAAGSQLRKEILDALRVPVIADLGAPIVFHETRLDVDGDVAFVRGVTAMRPGGVPIDLSQTPLFHSGDENIYSTNVQAFVKRIDGHWEVDVYVVDPTDIWWIGPPYCDDYATLLPTGACE